MLFVSKNDSEHDNVFGVFKDTNQTAKFGFSLGEQFKPNQQNEMYFSEPNFSSNDFELIQTINPILENDDEQKTLGCLTAIFEVIGSIRW